MGYFIYLFHVEPTHVKLCNNPLIECMHMLTCNPSWTTPHDACVLPPLMQLATDIGFGFPTDTQMKMHTEFADTYYYIFGFRGSNHSNLLPEWMGQYLLYTVMTTCLMFVVICHSRGGYNIPRAAWQRRILYLNMDLFSTDVSRRDS